MSDIVMAFPTILPIRPIRYAKLSLRFGDWFNSGIELDPTCVRLALWVTSAHDELGE